MIKAIKDFDHTAAAGVLAQAALSVPYVGSPMAPSIERPHELIARVIDEARAQLGITKDENDPGTFERIADFLDAEADKLLAPPNTDSALIRLAERGDLPSDLYEINIIQNIMEVYGKQFPLEKQIIETTIRSPTLEQHYGPVRKPHEPAMISLFLRSFRTKWPLKDFFVIVAAQRNGFRLDVHQAWRVYPWKVDLKGAETPVDWLRKFADHYGFEIEVEGRKGHFFLMAEGPIPNEVKFQHPAGRAITSFISRFAQNDPVTKKETSALIVAINVEKYQETLKLLGVRRNEILERFVPAPRARG